MPRIRTVRRRAKVIVATVVAASAAAGAAVVGSGWLDERDAPTSAPVATTNPTVTGTAEVGRELSCAPGTWERTPTQYAITWKDSARATVATGSPYVIADPDEGKRLRCEVTAANAVGSGKARSTLTTNVAAPNPLLFVSDSLTDADDTNLSAHTGELGATWTKHPSLTRDTFITSNRARGDGNTGRSRYYASAVPTGADYDVEAVFTWSSTIVGSDITAIWGRLSTSVDTGYQARHQYAIGGFELVKVVAGTATRLGSVYADLPAIGSTRTIKLEMRGPAIKMYVDEVVRVSVTDSAITAAGRVGIGTRTSTATTGIHIDSVQAVLPSPTAPLCANGDDDDADTFVDFPDDPGCADANDNDEFNEPLPECSNGIDDDADTDIDFPDDSGCTDADDDDETAPIVYVCSDGLDNDSDGDTDFPDDIGCTDAEDTDEFNAPDPLCDDGIDNDSPPDGLIDFGVGPTNDPGCADADDNDEFDVPPPPDPQQGLANLWMDTTPGTCSRFTTPSEYVDAASCSTNQAAYTNCSSGDLILMRDGQYPGSRITYRATHAAYAERCVFSPAPDATVYVNVISSGIGAGRALWVEAENIEFRGQGAGFANYKVNEGIGNFILGSPTAHAEIQITYTNNSGTGNDCQGSGGWAKNIVVDGLTMNTNTVTCAEDVTIKNSTWTGGSSYNGFGPQPIWGDGPVTRRLLNPRVEGNVMYGFLRQQCDPPDNSGCSHTNSLFFQGGVNIYVGKNFFAEASVSNLQFKLGGVGDIDGITIEGNIFTRQCGNGDPCGSNPDTNTMVINFGSCGAPPGCGDILIRFNSFAGAAGISTLGEVAWSSAIVAGNAVGGTSSTLWSCVAGANYKYNTSTAGSICDATDQILPVNYVSYVPFAGIANDLHLAVAAQAVDNFVPTSVPGGCPSVDIDGDTRPAAANCDGGADER